MQTQIFAITKETSVLIVYYSCPQIVQDSLNSVRYHRFGSHFPDFLFVLLFHSDMQIIREKLSLRVYHVTVIGIVCSKQRQRKVVYANVNVFVFSGISE